MASEQVLEFTSANFEEEVLKADGPVLVDFWAEWCMPCRMLAPTIDQLASEFEGKVKIGKVDTDANRDLAEKYQISAIPTVMVFKGGEIKHKFYGLTSKDDLAGALSETAG
jgi:thioredoxin 1